MKYDQTFILPIERKLLRQIKRKRLPGIKLRDERELLMKRPAKTIQRFLADQDGPTVVEYSILLALIVAGCFLVMGLIGAKVKATFLNLESGLPTNP